MNLFHKKRKHISTFILLVNKTSSKCSFFPVTPPLPMMELTSPPPPFSFFLSLSPSKTVKLFVSEERSPETTQTFSRLHLSLIPIDRQGLPFGLRLEFERRERERRERREKERIVEAQPVALQAFERRERERERERKREGGGTKTLARRWLDVEARRSPR